MRECAQRLGSADSMLWADFAIFKGYNHEKMTVSHATG